MHTFLLKKHKSKKSVVTGKLTWLYNDEMIGVYTSKNFPLLLEESEMLMLGALAMLYTPLILSADVTSTKVATDKTENKEFIHMVLVVVS